MAAKASPSASAVILRRFLLSVMFVRVGEERRSSEVIRVMIAVTASQRLMSEVVRGKFMFGLP